MPQALEPIVRIVGKVGNVARGVVFGIVGGFMAQAALSYDSKKPVGLDAALHKLAGHPYGIFLLAIVAAGLICFGVYCFAEARYRRL
jgi:formate/nitrite transporter FocA (FNT family)